MERIHVRVRVYTTLYSVHACSHKVSANCSSLYALHLPEVLDPSLKVGPCNVSPNYSKSITELTPGAGEQVTMCATTRVR